MNKIIKSEVQKKVVGLFKEKMRMRKKRKTNEAKKDLLILINPNTNNTAISINITIVIFLLFRQQTTIDANAIMTSKEYQLGLICNPLKRICLTDSVL